MGSTDAGEDIVQKTFMTLWELRERFEGGKPSAFLNKVAENTLMNEMSKARRRKELETKNWGNRLDSDQGPASNQASPEKLLSTRQERQVTATCIQELRREERLVLEERYLEPPPYVEGSTRKNPTLEQVQDRLRQEHALFLSMDQIKTRSRSARSSLALCLIRNGYPELAAAFELHKGAPHGNP